MTARPEPGAGGRRAPGLAAVIRPATTADTDVIAEIWRRGWHDGHVGHVPRQLVEARQDATFRVRAAEHVDDTTVAVVDATIAGFVTVIDDEIEQIYIDNGYRGTEVAGGLLAHGETLVAANGYERAWLAVVPGNQRARRFYEKHGWTDRCLIDYDAAGEDGPIPVPAHRYEKDLGSR